MIAATATVPLPDLAAAVAALARGAVVVYPTETFYALGARVGAPTAVDAVAALKGRDTAKPIAVIASERAMLAAVVARIPAPAEALIERFWPGPLTLVLPARAGLPAPLVGPDGRIGVRVSGHPVARALAAAAGEPVTATSANPGGAAPAAVCGVARGYFGARVAAYIDGGTLGGGAGSTVLVVDDDAARVVRAGAVAVEALRAVLGATPILPG